MGNTFWAGLGLAVRVSFTQRQIVMLALGWRLMEVDPAQALVAEEDFVESVRSGWSEGNGLFAQAVANVIASVAPADFALGFDGAHFVTAGVFDGWQDRRQRARTGLVAAGGSGQTQGLVGTLMVVDGAPGV